MLSKPLSDQNLDKILTFLSNQEEFVFLETSKPEQANNYSYIFTNPHDQLILKAGDESSSFFAKLEEYQKLGFYLAGWLAYELGYKLEPSLHHLQKKQDQEILANLAVFPEPIIFNHTTGSFNTPLPGSASICDILGDPGYEIKNLRANQPRQDYLNCLQRIKSYIEAGDTYQVNYTLKLLFDFIGSPNALYTTLRRNQAVSYGAYLKLGDTTLQSFSPELFFRKVDNKCTVRPMKGTLTRGRSQAEDLQQINDLHHDPKNRSENVMIVDLLRNDLGRLAKMGEVETLSLFDVETFQTLHQMTSTVQANLRPHLGVEELFKALFPCGSITGAPKIRTMEIISELEVDQRGAYTGGIGFIAPTGDMIFNVPIRTIKLQNGKGEMGIGSGIIHESNPEKEWQECLLKGNFLTKPLPVFQLIETVLWQPHEGYWLLEHHLDRLSQSAACMQFQLNIDEVRGHLQKLSNEWYTNSQTVSVEPANQSQPAKRVRLLLHKDGRFTVNTSPCELPGLLELPGKSDIFENKNKITLSKIRTDASASHFFHKTTHREIYNSERALAVKKGFIEVIFLNEKEQVTEGSITNLIIKKGEQYFTPPVACGLLPGTFRAYLLTRYPEMIFEKILKLTDLQEADNIYLANSIRGLMEVELELPQH